MTTNSHSAFFRLGVDPAQAQMVLGSFLNTASPSTSSCDTPEPSDSPPRPEHASPSRSSSASPVRTSTGAGRRHKRVRPLIDLAPGQPPTVRGNPRIRVVVACRQCRARKVRCDGAKPICCNCQKRSLEAERCSYDSGTNRRGREKGSTRLRPARGAAKQKTSKPTAGRQAQDGIGPLPPAHSNSVPGQNKALPSSSNTSPTLLEYSGDDGVFDFSDEMAWEYDAPTEIGLLPDILSIFDSDLALPLEPTIVTPPKVRSDAKDSETIPTRPSAQFSRDTWWDALLSLYADDHGFGGGDTQLIASSHMQQRNMAMKSVMSDLRALFQSSPCWVSYIHLPRFFDTLFCPVRRRSLQPSLMLAALALGTLFQSSEAEYGAKGRDKALKLLDMANGAIASSLATGWVDIGIVQAAVLIVFFEMQSHPKQCFARSRSALYLVDSLLRLFGLTRIDENLKPRGLSSYGVIQPQGYNPAGFMPPMQNASHNWSTSTCTPFQGQHFVSPSNASSSLADGVPFGSSPHPNNHPPPSQGVGCNCAALSLGQHWPSIDALAPSWRGTIMWPEGLSEGEFRREECRRILWSSIMAVANLNVYTVAHPNSTIPRFENMLVREPEQFSLLFPSEVLANTNRPVEADDIWTLNCRTTLLMHVCTRTRENPHLSLADRAQLSVQAWVEIEDIEQRLGRHTCGLDRSFGFQAKEMLFAMRMLTSYEFQRFIPQVTTTGNILFYRDKAEEWLKYIEKVGDSIWKSTSEPGTGSPSQEHRKSVLVYWILSNVRKAIALWKVDHGLIRALEFAKRRAEHAEHLLMLWPNLGLRQVWQGLRYALVEACLEAGIPLPPPSLPRAIPKVDPTTPVPEADFSDLIHGTI